MRVRVVLAAIAAALLLFAAPARAQDGKKVLKLGWAQDPQTLSVFLDYDEEDFRIWAINYDLLVNFSPDNLGPAPGIAESWDVSDDKKTVTFHLIKGAKWSDGEPITSKDVKFSLDVLGDNGALFTGYTDNVTLGQDARRRDRRRQDQEARRTDRRWPLPLHDPGAHLGQAVGEGADDDLQAADADGRQRPVRRHRVQAQPDHPDGAEPELPRAEAEVRRASVDQVRERRRGRARADARRDRRDHRGPGAVASTA